MVESQAVKDTVKIMDIVEEAISNSLEEQRSIFVEILKSAPKYSCGENGIHGSISGEFLNLQEVLYILQKIWENNETTKSKNA
jgi:hypothetical protein